MSSVCRVDCNLYHSLVRSTEHTPSDARTQQHFYLNKTNHTSRTSRVTVIVIEKSGIGASGYRGFGEGNTSRVSSEYCMTRKGNRTFWGEREQYIVGVRDVIR